MRVNRSITITSGTPVNVWTGTGAAETTPVMARAILLQMKHGGTGIGYVLAGISRNRVPSASNSADLSAELAPASATAPGGGYSDSAEVTGIDVSRIWIDGSVSGDVVICTVDLKV